MFSGIESSEPGPSIKEWGCTEISRCTLKKEMIKGTTSLHGRAREKERERERETRSSRHRCAEKRQPTYELLGILGGFPVLFSRFFYGVRVAVR